MREESSWSARSRAAARTNELDADERRTIMDSEEGSFVLACEGGRALSPAWLAEWSRKHPFGAAPALWRDAMTMCPGTGLLSQMIERGLVAGLMPLLRACPGLGDLPWSVGVSPAAPAALAASVASAASRW